MPTYNKHEFYHAICLLFVKSLCKFHINGMQIFTETVYNKRSCEFTKCMQNSNIYLFLIHVSRDFMLTLANRINTFKDVRNI